MSPGEQRGRRELRFWLGLVALFLVAIMGWLAVWVLVPAAFGWKPLAVTGGSMGPSIKAGDVVVVSPLSQEPLTAGAVVAFDHPTLGGSVTHRVTRVNDDGSYVTRGDANAVADSTPVRHEDVAGVGRVLVPLAGLPVAWRTNGQYALLAAWLAACGLSLWGCRFALLTRYDPWRPVAQHSTIPHPWETPTATDAAPRRQGRPRRERPAVWRPRPVTAAVLLLFAVTVTTLGGTSRAQFTDTTANPANTWAASEWLQSPENLTAGVDCVTASLITHVASSTGAGDHDSPSASAPAGTQEDDVLVMSYVSRYTVTFTSVPDGWVQLLQEGTMYVFLKVAGPDEPASYTWEASSGQRHAMGISAYRGADPDDPVDAYAAQTNPSTDQITAPSVTTTVDDAMLVGFFAIHHRDPTSTPTSMSERWNLEDGGQGGVSHGVRSASADEPHITAGPTGERVALGGGNEDNYGALLALAPEQEPEVALSWDPTPTETADGYYLERWAGGALDDSWTIIPRSETSFVDDTAAEGVTYEYRLRAFEDDLESSAVTTGVTPICGS